jgi:hypothetical protein
LRSASTMKLSAPLNKDLEDALVSLTGKPNPSPEQMEHLLSLAVQEYCAWIRGEERPLSISEWNRKRVVDLYRSVLPQEMPQVKTLVRRLKLPYGQARYLMQAIAIQEYDFLQGKQARALYGALENSQPADAEGSQDCYIALELRTFFEDFCIESGHPLPNSAPRRRGNYLIYRINQDKITVLLASLKAEFPSL